MKKAVLIILTALLFVQLYGQMESVERDSIYHLTIEQAVNYALEHNAQIINGKLDIKKAKWQIWQTTAMGLPQVNGSIQYTQYPNLPTQLMPNFLTPVIVQVNTQIFGLQPQGPLPNPNEKIPVHFGSEYNAQWGITVSQLIFSGEYLVGLHASRIFKQLAEQNLQKTQRDIRASIEQSYVLVLIAEQSLRIMNESYDNAVTLRDKTEHLVAQGMGEDVQLDQMNYMVYQLKNQIKSVERQNQVARRLLKFQLGMKMEDSLVLETTLDQVLSDIKLGNYLDTSFSVNQNIDYQLIMSREYLAHSDLRREQAKFLPQVSGFFSYGKNAYSDEFNLLSSDQRWFKTVMFGFKVQIPIWDNGAKLASVMQKKIDYLKIDNTREMMQQQLKIQYRQAYYNFINAFDRMLNEQRNIEFTRKIYDNTRIKYLKGAASSLELTQAQNQYLQAQGNYYSALLDVIKAKTALEKFIH